MQKKQLTLVIVSLLVVVLSVSLAYFTAQIIGKGKNVTINSADLKIIFTDNDGSISGTNIEPGKWNVTKTFTIENKSNETYKYNIVIKDLVNTFVTTGYLQYKITSTNGGYNMTEFKDVPKSSTPKDKILAYSVSIPVGVTQSYTIEFKYANNESIDQSDDMGKTLSGKLFITEGTINPAVYYAGYEKGTIGYQIMSDNPTRLTRTDFNTTFTETNTGTLYKATESIAGNTFKDVYYFAGDAKNNWVKFGKYQNDLIRYRGYYSATSTTDYHDYSTMDECTSASSYNINCTEYKYANTGDDIYWRIIRTNHDGSIRLLYSGTSHNTTAGYIATSLFTDKAKMDPMYAGYMYGTTGSLENNRLNINDSTIKTYIDNWYNNNLSSYSKYISTEAVYCNDRELAPGQTYSTSSSFDYAPSGRLDTNKPTYNCTNNKDAFSGNNSEAKLTYPIGLMTADEIAYAGGKVTPDLPSPYAWYYLNSAGGSITGSTTWWSLSPDDSRDSLVGVPDVWIVCGSDLPGRLQSGFAFTKSGVRPAISLKTCTLWTSGNGAPETPYEISTTSGC